MEKKTTRITDLAFIVIDSREKEICISTSLVHKCSQKLYFLQPQTGNNPNTHQQRNG